MIKKRFFIAFVSFLLALPSVTVNAQSIDISLNGQTFMPGDEVQANVFFTNPTNQQLSGHIICNFASLSQELPPMPFKEEFDLGPNEKSRVFTFRMDIGVWMPEGLYKAEIEVMDDKETPITKSFEEFRVLGTLKNIDAALEICNDKDCSQRKVVFVKGETVYLKLDGSVLDYGIYAVLTSPDNEAVYPVFENHVASFKADEVGSFLMAIDLSKEGYQNQRIENSFAVIDAPADIETVSECDGNGVCENKENHKTCPQDCSSGLEDDYCDGVADGICDPDCSRSADTDCKISKYSTYAYYAIAILLLIVIAISAYKKIQEKRKWDKLEKKMSKLYE